MHKVIVTLTTISSRLKNIHLVIDSLLDQSFSENHYEVRLHLSKGPYLLDEGCPDITEELKRILKEKGHRFSIVYVENSGPYRKIIPVMSEVYSYAPEQFGKTLVVTADDDTSYPRTWLQVLYQNFLQYNCIVGYRGRSMVFAGEKVISYKKWSKNIVDNPSRLNVPTGKDGVLYSPFHLNPEVLDLESAIRYAPKADDLWLKAHSLLAGMPSLIINTNLDQEFSSVTGREPEVSLYRSFNQKGGNDEALDNITDYLLKSFDVSIYNLCYQERALALGTIANYLMRYAYVE